MKNMNRMLSLLLALCMMLSLLPASALAVETSDVATEGLVSSDVEITEMENPGLDLTSGAETELETESQGYDAADIVTVVVVMEEKSLLDQGYTKRQISVGGAALTEAKAAIAAEQDALLAEIAAVTGETVKMGYRYNVLITGFSVDVPYGALSAIEAMDGVRAAFVAPVYSVPEDMSTGSDLETDTYATTDTFGTALAWQSLGYTGAGMRIAILDTGLDVDHPSFVDAPALTETSLTMGEVSDVISELNAAVRYAEATGEELTAEDVYYNEKVPFGFNYGADSLDITHDNDASGDHGTHVAGIAAANKLDSTDVVGVAPDAQLIVMKIFQPSGGASFVDMVAALEDCYRLNVDAVNMSLGADAGFTTIGYEIWDEIFAKLTESDMIAAVSAGNAYSAAFRNGYGTDTNLTMDPDNGIVSEPASWIGTTMVASLDNTSVMVNYFTVGESNIAYADAAAYYFTDMAGTYEYVMVPGVGSEEDFASVDVEGRIAVISRGELDFTVKQTNAYNAGAVACIIYDNVDGDLIYIVDAGLMPNIFITKADGAIMAENAVDGVGTIVIRGADEFIPVRYASGGQLSDFSSWGVTPDLQLEPDVTAPGGSIYSTLTDGQYGSMSGTSMSAPHIAGMAALVLQYLHAEHSELTDAQMHTVAEALIMSTATPVMEYDGVEYSPRKQGAGAANVYDAIISGGYLTVNGSTPKISMGDDDSRSGAYSFSFEINNFSDRTLSYELDASLLTDLVDTTYSELGYLFMSESSKGLSSEPTFYIQEGSIVEAYDANGDSACDLKDVQYLLDGIQGLEPLSEETCADFDLDADGDLDTVDAQLLYEAIVSGLTESNVVVVEAGQTITVSVSIQLNAEDMAYMDANYPNGIYVEGFVRAYALDAENADLSLPFMGFYGDWSAARVFDGGWYYDAELEYNRYANVLWTDLGTNSYYLGMNPYMEEAYDPIHNVLSPNDDDYFDEIEDIYLSMMRSARTLRFTYTNAETGEVLHEAVAEWVSKSYYNYSAGICYPFLYSDYFDEAYDFTDAEGKTLPNGTTINLTIEACLDDGDEVVDETVVVPVTIDTEKPEILNARKLHDVETGDRFLEVTFRDNVAVAAVGLLSMDGVRTYALDAVEDGEPDENGYRTYTVRYDVTDMPGKLMLILADYGLNEAAFGLNMGGEGAAYGDLVAYQYNFYTGVNGWVSFNADVDENETSVFTSNVDFVCAEYVNGYLYAQTESGALYGFAYDALLRDGNALEAIYITQLENVYQDLAYSYAEGKLYGLYTSTDSSGYPTTELYSINLKGEYYDSNLWTTVGAYAETWTVGRGGVYGLGLAIDDAGTVYILGPNYDWDTEDYTESGHLWTAGLEWNRWTNAYELSYQLTEIGDTGLSMDYLQSMTWDHNTETLYWARFAPDGWDLYCELLTVDPATAACTKVGTLSGETCALVAPLTAETAALEAHANVPEMDSSIIGTPLLRDDVVTMNVGGTKTLTLDFDPWYTAHKDLVWTSSDTEVVTVDENGTLTAVGTGSATITVANREDETKLDTCSVEVTALDLKLEGIATGQTMGTGATGGVGIYEYTMVDGVASMTTGEIAITAPDELNYGLSLSCSTYGRGSIWACEYGNTGMIYEIDPETGVVKDALSPIDGDMLFGMAYSESMDLFTGIMNMYLFVDLPFTHEAEEDMLESYDEELKQFTWHRINMLPYLLESNTGFITNETGNGASSEIVFCGVTIVENSEGKSYYETGDYMGSGWAESTYIPAQTLMLLDNVGRIWYIDEITGMTRYEDEWGNVAYTKEDGSMISADLNGVEAVEYVDEEGNSTYNVFFIRALEETPLTNMFREGLLPRITYHFSDIAYAGSTADGAPMLVMSLYDYWNNGITNELYLYIPGVGTGEYTWDENWNRVEIKTPDRLYVLGDTGEHNIIATINKAEVTGGVDPETPEAGPEAINPLTAGIYTGKEK